MSQWQPYSVISVADPDFSAKMAHDASPWDPGKGMYITDKLLYDVVKAGLNEKDPTDHRLGAVQGPGRHRQDRRRCRSVRGPSARCRAGPRSPASTRTTSPTCRSRMQVDGKFQSTVGGDLRLAINKNTKCMDAAKAWVSYFIDDSGYAANEAGIPTSLNGRAPGLVQGLPGQGRQPLRRERARRRARKVFATRSPTTPRSTSGATSTARPSSTMRVARPRTAWTRSSPTSTSDGPKRRPPTAAERGTAVPRTA